MINVIHTGPYGVNTLIVPLAGPYVFIVDPACCTFCNDEKVLLSYLESKSLIPLAFVLTHGHYDHVAGISIMKNSFPSVPLLIHENDSKMIGKSAFDFQKEDLCKAGFSSFLDCLKDLKEVDGFLKEDKSLFDCIADSKCKNLIEDKEVKKALSEWKIISTPGHTMGSVCLYNKEQKLLISGDTLFYGAWGRTDLKGGSEELMIKSLKKLHDTILPDAKVYPGHDYYGFELKEFFL